MRNYLLDTSPLAAYLLGRPQIVETVNPWLDQHAVATSILVYGEVVEYLKGLPNFPRQRTQLREQLQEIRPYLLTYPMMERYATIRRQLRPPQGPGLIGDIDTLIAATALEQKLTLVTTDSDFERIPHLKVMLIGLAVVNGKKTTL
jgi:predicted nucleic acid-binding protein